MTDVVNGIIEAALDTVNTRAANKHAWGQRVLNW